MLESACSSCRGCSASFKKFAPLNWKMGNCAGTRQGAAWVSERWPARQPERSANS